MDKKIYALPLAFILILPTIIFFTPVVSSQEFPHVEAEKIISPERASNGELVEVTIKLRGAGGVILTPVDVVLILDRSGSMTGQKIRDAKEAAKTFLDFTDVKDRVGVITYSNKIRIDYDLHYMNSTNKETLKDRIDEYRATDATNIYDAIVTANDILLNSPRINAPLVEVLLTDGLHNYPSQLSDAEFEALAQSMKEDHIIIFTVGVGSDVNTARLQMIAETTGGQYFFAPTSTELNAIFQEIGSMLAFAGTNIIVTETIPYYVVYNEDASEPPDEVTANEETTLMWDVGSLKVGDEWEVTYTAVADRAVEVSDQEVQCLVEYITAEAASAIINLTPGLIFHDLAVTLFVAEPDKVTQGDIIDLTATVENTGVAYDTFDVEMNFDNTLLNSQSIPLDPGQSRNVTFSWNTSAVDAGKYDVTVVLDPDVEIWEEDRSDNTASVEVEVTPPPFGERFIIFIILFIIVTVIAVGGVAYSELKPRRGGPSCPVCKETLNYNSRTGRWHCPRCRRYVS